MQGALEEFHNKCNQIEYSLTPRRVIFSEARENSSFAGWLISGVIPRQISAGSGEGHSFTLPYLVFYSERSALTRTTHKVSGVVEKSPINQIAPPQFCMSKSKQNHRVAHATEVQPGAMSLVFLWKMEKIRNLLRAVSLVFLRKMSKIRNLPGPCLWFSFGKCR